MIDVIMIITIAIVLISAFATWLLWESDKSYQEMQHEVNLELLTLDPVPLNFLKTKRQWKWILMPIITSVILILFIFSLARALSEMGNLPLSNVLTSNKPHISEIFTEQVRMWEPQILRWSREYNLDPDMIATVMQIESCGNPNAISPSQAQGLFQVMPFHFKDNENMLDPETNARRGLEFLRNQLTTAESKGNINLAFAAYNGGGSIFNKSYDIWPNETQRYYRWASGIYNENKEVARNTLDSWLQAGGERLCS